MDMANNPVGLDATVAWYGFGLFLYAVFDLLFLTAFYKSGLQGWKIIYLCSNPYGFSHGSDRSYCPHTGIYLDG